MKLYRALKHFDSALVGGKIPGDTFYYGEDSAKPLIEEGLIELVRETKPAPAAKKETKPKATKKSTK